MRARPEPLPLLSIRNRRRLVATPALLAVALLWMPSGKSAWAFSFEDVAERAKTLAAAPYKKPGNLPAELQNINYDQYRDIRFNPAKSYWRGTALPFEIGFYHMGRAYTQPVKISEITGDGVREIRYDAELFDYGANKFDRKKTRDLRYAGFRVHYPINTPQYRDEVLVFLGASYFRALGKDQRYGLSARGLAVDTAASTGEEFPSFVEFWVERPAPSSEQLVIYGLLDSVRVAGAYRFVLRPGAETSVDVKTRLYFRDNIGKLGIAPLTSMFAFGENQRAPREDFRPEAHDSDGLSIHTGTGEWIWRPLSNPKRLLVTSFALNNPIGFGLMQRDRHFYNYEDLEARYELRPSAWVEPKGQWGAGRVELVQIPSPDETNDNIVAFWVPDKPARAKESFEIEYRLLWQRETEKRPPLAWVTQTRRGHGYQRKADNSVAIVVDFEGPALKKLAPDTEVTGVVSLAGSGELLESVAYRNEVTGGWRLAIRLKRHDDSKAIELRGYLKEGDNTVSETWSYILPPA